MSCSTNRVFALLELVLTISIWDRITFAWLVPPTAAPAQVPQFAQHATAHSQWTQLGFALKAPVKGQNIQIKTMFVKLVQRIVHYVQVQLNALSVPQVTWIHWRLLSALWRTVSQDTTQINTTSANWIQLDVTFKPQQPPAPLVITDLLCSTGTLFVLMGFAL